MTAPGRQSPGGTTSKQSADNNETDEIYGNRETRRRTGPVPATHPETLFLEPLIPDMNGILRGKRVGTDDFYKAFTNGLNFCAAATMLDSHGDVLDSIPYGERRRRPGRQGIRGARLAWPGPLGQAADRLNSCWKWPTWMARPYPAIRETSCASAIKPLNDMGLTPGDGHRTRVLPGGTRWRRFVPKVPRIPGSDLPQGGAQYSMMEDLYEFDGFINELLNYCAIQNIPAEHRPVGILAGTIRSQPPPHRRPGWPVTTP